MGIEEFYVGAFPSRGCFSKNGVAYWSGGGSAEEISEVDLPGEQERIWCGGGSSLSAASAIVNTFADDGGPSTSASFDIQTFVLGVNVIAIFWLLQFM
jgi:hypothetical protein